MQGKILIIEDELDIVRMLEYNLKQEGLRVVWALNGFDGLKLVKKEMPDLVLLDLMLPEIDGLEVCRQMKLDNGFSQIPIIMLTAKSQEADKVAGLELGADDYMVKPFSLRELIARIKAVLRRKQNKMLNDVFCLNALNIDFGAHIVRVNGKKIALTSKEYELLKKLIDSHGRILSRDYLLDSVWGFSFRDEIQTRTIDVHIASLRKKLKEEGRRIVTVKNSGYRFDVEN